MKRSLISPVPGIAALFLCTGFASSGAGLPEPSGTYAVGRASYDLTDPNRSEPLSESSNAHRRMMVYVWYPTDREPDKTTLPAAYLPGFEEVKSRLSPGDI